MAKSKKIAKFKMATARKISNLTFLWTEQRCQILCLFCYFRLPWGNSESKVARNTKELVTLLWPAIFLDFAILDFLLDG